MTSYHPAVQLLYLCSAAYWLSQEALLGVVVQAWTIYWRLWTIFDFVSLHMWIILSLYATPSWMQNGTWATSVIFIMRSIPGDLFFFAFILDTSGKRLWRAWENESYNVNTPNFWWTDGFLAALLFFPFYFFCGGMPSNAVDMKTLSSPHEH